VSGCYRPRISELNVDLGLGSVPEGLAHRLCWEEFVAEVARVYETLPEKDRNESVFFTGHYAQAGAISLFGKEYGLPPARSYHNNYHL